ncbi:MAG: hypothetical protein IKN49_05945 [Elusimicrobiaceae bacterium]|nr:hypothetical protein [Elusimicrobiaceae bacterium]
MDNTQWDGQSDITRFLEKFNQPADSADFAFPTPMQEVKEPSSAVQEKYNQSFAKLEEKIQELEEKFAASTAQNEAVMQELARTRQVVENQQSREAFFSNIASTIANLKQSVENLSHVRPTTPVYNTPAITRTFDAPATENYAASAYHQFENYRAGQQAKLQAMASENDQALASLQNAWQQERDASSQALAAAQAESVEKARIISSLQQKASQLKAVNTALDREIKRTQQERTDALRKSADQAKEILLLRDALTAAEERFRSFDFKGRIISVKRQYEQKVSKLETQLHEMSTTCMKQVEEIESLKTENLKLQQLAEEREQLAALYEAKTRELETLQVQLRAEAAEKEKADQKRLAAFTQRMQRLQEEHETLAQRLTNAQQALKLVSDEKQTLEQNFKTLLQKIEKNDEVISGLKEKIAVLTEENRELKKGQASAATSPRPSAPVRQPVTVRSLPVQKAATTTAASKPTVPAVENAPVEMQNTLHAQVKTDADLPEIKVADPIPQPEVELEDDFLEKTDSFIGRMKWSIFREDK